MSRVIKIGSYIALGVSVVCQMSAYRKYCYTAHNYAGLKTPCVDSAMIARSKKRVAEQRGAVHAFTYTYEGKQCVVRLSRRDLKKVRELLSVYDKKLPIDTAFIDAFLAAHKDRRAVVAWIMQDFNCINPSLTIGDMLTILGLDKEDQNQQR